MAATQNMIKKNATNAKAQVPSNSSDKLSASRKQANANATVNPKLAALRQKVSDQKLSLSMPRTAVYPKSWMHAVRDMEAAQIGAVVDTLADDHADLREWEAAADLFLNHIRANNRKAAKRAKQAKKFATEGCGELSESAKASAEILQKRREEYLHDMIFLLNGGENSSSM